MSDARPFKCRWCWRAYAPVYQLQNGERRTGWQALTNHLADYGGLDGHPWLDEIQLRLAATGTVPRDVRADERDVRP